VRAATGFAPWGGQIDKSIDDPECISSLACTKACKLNAVTIEIGGVPLPERLMPRHGEA